VSRGTWVQSRLSLNFVYRAITFYGRPFQTSSTIQTEYHIPCPATPAKGGFRLFPFRSPLLGECPPTLGRGFFSFPPATKMFQFAEFPLDDYMTSYEVTFIKQR